MMTYMTEPRGTFADRVLAFYRQLRWVARLPQGIEVMNPYVRPEVLGCVEWFLTQYFADTRPRVFVLGINPGRFGSGTTGITFTDPVAMEAFCGIPNSFPKRRELSSEFIYELISSWGGVRPFYRQFFLSAVSPLGFLRGGKNFNYYERGMLSVVKPFIATTLAQQLACGGRTDVVILLGRGENQKAFTALNTQHRFFQRIYALDHPRFIMQYRRKRLVSYLRQYQETFSKALAAAV